MVNSKVKIDFFPNILNWVVIKRVSCDKSSDLTSSPAVCFRLSPAAMTTEDNGNVSLLKPTSSSNEDLSEYTDADESISAPTEFLAEVIFLFSVSRDTG